ncbi:putative membrane protein YczE [Weissella uvarum]|uniref:YczE/YyaS/YitT family protein n=1 Tax=Weissella uvarum TaxID=1479233 RepID=UPI0019606121|nr:hypothetical protein [Weissella uvarum]MBM7617678.1 putative membrane protein YczE [Weissella uvarum]MCM0596027.1 hypothetical protein [Weissella uvarum]
MKKVLQIAYIMVGLVIIGVAASTLRQSGLGVDPFTAFNIGLSTKLGMSLGVTQLCTNLIMMIYVFFNNKKIIGWGTLLNMTLVGVFIQIFTSVLQPLHLSGASFLMKLVLLVVGFLLFTLGSAIYMAGNMGTAPYDAVAPILSKQLHREYDAVRTWQDITFVILAFILAGPIGVGTIAVAFGAGSMISIWNKMLPKFPQDVFIKN